MKVYVDNQSGNDLVIQGQTISAGDSYSIQEEDLVTWAKDLLLRLLILNGEVVLAFDDDFTPDINHTIDILKDIASGILINPAE